jgi:phospholipid transport system substrate-binding protein
MLKRALFIYFSLTLTLLFAIDEGSIKSVMNKKVEQITSILHSDSSHSSKKSKIDHIVDPIFSYTTMSKIALGKHYKKLSASQKKRFISKFTKKLKSSYYDKLKLYTDQKVEIKSLKKVKGNRIRLYSNIVGSDKIYKVVYKFFNSKGGKNWLIYDVDIAGVSIIQTYRKQFTEFLRTKTVDQLISSL